MIYSLLFYHAIVNNHCMISGLNNCSPNNKIIIASLRQRKETGLSCLKPEHLLASFSRMEN